MKYECNEEQEKEIKLTSDKIMSMGKENNYTTTSRQQLVSLFPKPKDFIQIPSSYLWLLKLFNAVNLPAKTIGRLDTIIPMLLELGTRVQLVLDSAIYEKILHTHPW